MLTTARRSPTPAAATAAASFLCACATPDINTTRLRAIDTVRMTDRMAMSLAAADPDLPEHPVWTMDRVQNLTDHPMRPEDAWATMARLRAALARTDFAEENNITIVLPESQWRSIDPEERPADQPARLIPTHALRATFHADTTSALGRRGFREDTYLCAFRLINLSNGDIVWEDAFETRYSTARNRFD